LFLCFAAKPSQSQEKKSAAVWEICFFGPSLDEVDSLKEETAEAINDFSYYANKIVPFLRMNGIRTRYVSDRRIELQYDSLKTIVVCRDSVDFGTILMDGKNPPKVLKYVLTDIELKEEIETYYKFK
jgi:hypothetical protein